MSDPELEAIRRARLAELQGGSALGAGTGVLKVHRRAYVR